MPIVRDHISAQNSFGKSVVVGVQKVGGKDTFYLVSVIGADKERDYCDVVKPKGRYVPSLHDVVAFEKTKSPFLTMKLEESKEEIDDKNRRK
tara:strand:- start:327 stop:602 length:276 start_codon:yes stop_codon:yes gene_type:complete